MSAPVDYKSHELNLYSNNNVGRLRFVDGKGTGLGPGFGQNQEYIFAKYTDDAKGQYQWPVCIPELHTIDNSTGYVMGVSWYIMDTRTQVADEKKARENADADLSSTLSVESKARSDADTKLSSDLSDESKARISADQKLSDSLVADSKAHTDYEALLAGQITAEVSSRATAVSAVDGKLTVERTRALAAEGVIQSNVDDEAKARSDADSKLSDRIDFIVSNTNPSAIDSLSEIVSQFSQNGQGYASRLTYLESVVASLVNKSQ